MKTERILIETILITAISLLGMWFLPAAKTVFALIPVAYLLIERRLRKRSWSELGFKFKTFWPDLRANWIWFVLVGVVSQPAVALLTRAYFPAYLEHVKARLPFGDGMGWTILLPLLAISLVGEEMSYRTLIQGRLTPYLGGAISIVVASILFGFAHFSARPFWIVTLDVAMIFVDSVLFGIIYNRCNNLVVTWLAHFIGDVLGLIILFSI